MMMPIIPFASVDLKSLSEAELEIVVQVIQKDFELKAAEKARLRRHRRQLKDYDKRVSILASSNFNDRFCVICFQRFFFLLVPKRCCYSCRHSMCNGCSVWIPILKAFICLLCQKERNLKSMGCDWYYGLLKNRFQQDGSEIVAQSLYNNQGQWYIHLADSIITPDLLRKVKGAQISRYRQKIHAKWEEMQQRLNQVDRSDIIKSKKDEAWHYLIEEYKNHFRDILKEFSQFLYITLENYASKVDDPSLNINEQVITTVYDEVELMIGYRINYMPEEMGSMLSDVESTTSLFIGNQMEEKLASALVNKIIQDHSLSELEAYDGKGLPNFNGRLQADDESSTSYLYPNRPFKTGITNGTISGRSSTVASSFLDTEPSIEINKTNFMQYSSPQRTLQNNNSASTLEDMNDPMDISLTLKELKNIIRYSGSDRRSQKQQIERTINVPYGEPIKLQFQLNGISEIETTWTMTNANRTVILYNTDDTEIIESSEANSVTFYLKKWQTTGGDAGVYTASISNQPIVEFRVNIIVNNKKPVRPSFRLKMLNCSCRTSQIGEFSVEALGYPEPRVTFYYRNQLISTPDDKYKIEYKDQISRYILKILNVTENDHGTYKCVASNGSGFCECNAQLQVTNVKFRFDHKIPRSSSSNSSVEDDIFLVAPVQNNLKNEFVNDTPDAMGGPLNEDFQTTRDHMRSPNSYKNPNIGKEYSPSNTMKSPSKPKDYQTPSIKAKQGNIDYYQPPIPKKNQSNVEMYQTPSPKKNQSNAEMYQSTSPKKNQGNVDMYQPPSTRKTQGNVDMYQSTSPKKNQGNVDIYQPPSTRKTQGNTEMYQPPNTRKTQGNTEMYQPPSTRKTQGNVEIHQSPSTRKTQGNTEMYQTPSPKKGQSNPKDYSTQNTAKSPSKTRDYQTSNMTKSQSSARDYSPPDSIQSKSSLRDYSKPNIAKSPSIVRDHSAPNTIRSPPNIRENPPRNSSRNQDPYKPIVSPNTVVGREIPDEFKSREKPDVSRSPRTIYSYSTENLDSIDSPSKASRNEAMKSSRYSLSGSNSNISKLKQLFEQPEFPTVQRNSSITGRTPRPDSRTSQSPFTKEVRVMNYDSTN